LPIPKKKARAKDIGISVPFALELIKNEEAANPRNLRSDNPGYKQQMAYPAIGHSNTCDGNCEE